MLFAKIPNLELSCVLARCWRVLSICFGVCQIAGTSCNMSKSNHQVSAAITPRSLNDVASQTYVSPPRVNLELQSLNSSFLVHVRAFNTLIPICSQLYAWFL